MVSAGWWLIVLGLEGALMHSGSNTMNYATVWMAPAKDFAVLVATNQAGGDTFNACAAASALIRRVARK